MAKKAKRRNPWKEARVWRVTVRPNMNSISFNTYDVVADRAEEAAGKGRRCGRVTVTGWHSPCVTNVEQIAVVDA